MQRKNCWWNCDSGSEYLIANVEDDWYEVCCVCINSDPSSSVD